jgi:hypothetical protein
MVGADEFDDELVDAIVGASLAVVVTVRVCT